MKVTFAKDHVVSPDGTTVELFRKGATVDLRDDLAQRLVAQGTCTTGGAAKTKADAKAKADAEADAGKQEEPGTTTTAGGDAPAVDPIDGLNAKDAIATITELTLEQLDAIADGEDRKTVLEAIAARRAELAAA